VSKLAIPLLLSLWIAIVLGLTIDLAGPEAHSGSPVARGSSIAGASLADDMNSQISAGFAGGAIALFRLADRSSQSTTSARIALCRAIFEIGDAPHALELVNQADQNCRKNSTPCSTAERLEILRLQTLISAIVEDGIVDIHKDPQKAHAALAKVLHPAGFSP